MASADRLRKTTEQMSATAPKGDKASSVFGHVSVDGHVWPSLGSRGNWSPATRTFATSGPAASRQRTARIVAMEDDFVARAATAPSTG